MRWDYPPPDINPVFSGLLDIIIIIIIIVIIIIIIIIIIICFVVWLTKGSDDDELFFDMVDQNSDNTRTMTVRFFCITLWFSLVTAVSSKVPPPPH